MNYLFGLIFLCTLFKFNDGTNQRFEDIKEIINLVENNLNNTTQFMNESDEDENKNKITCHCNICIDAYYCMTNGACFLSSKYNQKDEKIYTQGCIDRMEQDSYLENYCSPNDQRPKRYERQCCTRNLCNGNTTIPYDFDDSYTTENIYLFASVCAVIFLTLIAFILFFSCRLDMR